MNGLQYASQNPNHEQDRTTQTDVVCFEWLSFFVIIACEQVSPKWGIWRR